MHRYTGRGLVGARTTVDDNIIVCVLETTLTKADQQLVENGKEKVVLSVAGRYRPRWRMRRSLLWRS
jgi:uncharacterized protein YbcI